MTIVLIRHPAAEISPGICYGRLDIPADAAALEQAAQCAAGLVSLKPARVLTSPSRRCRDLADRLAAALDTVAATDPRLLELDFGAWEGKPWDTVPRADLDLWAASPLTFSPPGGETGAALIARIGDVLVDLRRERGNYLVVTHGGPLKVLTALLNGNPVDLLAAAPALGSFQNFDDIEDKATS